MYTAEQIGKKHAFYCRMKIAEARAVRKGKVCAECAALLKEPFSILHDRCLRGLSEEQAMV